MDLYCVHCIEFCNDLILGMMNIQTLNLLNEQLIKGVANKLEAKIET